MRDSPRRLDDRPGVGCVKIEDFCERKEAAIRYFSTRLTPQSRKRRPFLEASIGTMLAKMKVTLNGEQIAVHEACNVEALLEQLQMTGRLAVELNGEIVPRSRYPALRIQEGDRIEVIRAVGGG